MSDEAYNISMWLRADVGETFSLQFNINNGRGIFRVSRPGVLEDSPANNEGMICGLTLADLHASEFLLVPSQGHRKRYLFNDLAARHLSALPLNTWSALQVVMVDGQCSFLLSDDGSVPIGDEPETTSTDPEDEIDTLQRTVRALTLELAAEREKAHKLEKMAFMLEQELRQLLGDEGEL